MDLYELPESDLEIEEQAKELAETAHGMALDNGSDMLGVNPEQHAEEEWDGYLEHTLIIYADEGGISLDAPIIDTLSEKATEYWN